MIAGRRVAVVVPACDEESWIGEVVRSMPEFVDQVIVVDDGSRDGTVAASHAAAAPGRLTVLQHDCNSGVGAAIATGYRHALGLGVDVVAVMAGDAQMDPRDLLAVVLPVARAEADYVKGDRLRHPEMERMPLSRRLGTRMLARVTSWAAGRRVHDSQCGYTAIGADTLRRLDLGALWPRYGYPNDLIGAVARAGARIHEVTVRPVYLRENGRQAASGIRPWHAFGLAYVLGRVALRRLVTDGASAETPAWPRDAQRFPTQRETPPAPG